MFRLDDMLEIEDPRVRKFIQQNIPKTLKIIKNDAQIRDVFLVGKNPVFNAILNPKMNSKITKMWPKSMTII